MELKNGQTIDLKEVPVLKKEEFRETLISSVREGGRISAFFAHPQGASFHLYAVIAYDKQSFFRPYSTVLSEKSYPSLTSEIPQIHLFEREIYENWGITPDGHPWLKPVRFPLSALSLEKKQGDKKKKKKKKNEEKPDPVGVMDYFEMEGEEVHEVAVGPVHAGVIEPGHFRFQCHGEKVYHLEISLGYQHRGMEKQLLGGPHKRSFYQIETVAGDTTLGHGLSYCHLLESLSGTEIPARAVVLRGIALELERLANHVGDLGALAVDVGFLPTSSGCGALRGDYLNLTALLCGNRLGRSFLKPGGIQFDPTPEMLEKFKARLKSAFEQTRRMAEILFNTPSVLARYENTGPVTEEQARAIGLVGPAARASGISMDIRVNHPMGVFQKFAPKISLEERGDVYSRAFMRWLETQTSVALIEEMLQNLPSGNISTELQKIAPLRFGVACTEGWRGEVCHVVLTDSQGKFGSYKVVDPSFHNWFGLAMALRNQAIFDFPLCNKSFNLSYCGFDL